MQTFPSSQSAFVAAWSQESIDSLHKSAVQATPSSHDGGVPGAHVPAVQTSVPLQKSPSWHCAASVQPVTGGVNVTDSSGRYVLANLPPGNYLLCALTDVDEGQWNEAGFLDPLVPASVRITLTEGERKVQDLRVGG